jgi:DNA-directed RNA polymerase alpha subunit
MIRLESIERGLYAVAKAIEQLAKALNKEKDPPVSYDAFVQYLPTDRIRNAIINEGCKSIDDICDITESEWLKVPNISHVSVHHLKHTLAKFNRELRKD